MRKTMLITVAIGALAACDNAAAPVAPRPTAQDVAAARDSSGLPFKVQVFTMPSPFNGNPIFGISGGPDGNAWVTDADYNEIIRVTPQGTITEFPIPTDNAVPTEIGEGPDRNMWFSEYTANAIARITPEGVVTEFPLPAWLAATGSGPRGIVTGPDNKIWFAHDAGYIGRMSRTGELLALYPTPTPASGALIITPGPDGDLWFTEANVNQIGRINMNGKIKEFAIPTPASVPVGIVAGRDGALYFTERSASQIGRITVRGEITEFPTPTPSAMPQRIAALPNGDVWFVEANSDAGQLGHVLGNGKNIKEYALPAPVRPFAFAAIGDRTLWYTDGDGTVGKVTVKDDK